MELLDAKRLPKCLQKSMRKLALEKDFFGRGDAERASPAAIKERNKRRGKPLLWELRGSEVRKKRRKEERKKERRKEKRKERKKKGEGVYTLDHKGRRIIIVSAADHHNHISWVGQKR